MRPYFRLFALVFFFCILLSCDKSDYKDASYDPISIDGFSTEEVMSDASFLIVDSKNQLQEVLPNDYETFIGKVDFSKRNMLLIHDLSGKVVYEITREMSKSGSKYIFDIKVTQSCFDAIQYWCIAYDVPKSMEEDDVVVEISYENPIY